MASQPGTDIVPEQPLGAGPAALEGLPLRALASFACRCARRVEPLRQLWHSLPVAYAAGLPEPPIPGQGHHAVRAADRAALVAVNALDPDADESYWAVAAADALREAARATGDGAVSRAAAADLATLHALRLGAAGEPGEPIRWDDPRLGPLWPDGPPEWYVEAEARCREIEARLRALAEPPAEVLPDEVLAQLDECAWLNGRWEAGELDEHRGRWLVAANRTIFAADPDLLQARNRARVEAEKVGIPYDRLANYYVPAT